MYGLEGKVALVTGAGGENGIGRGIATRLALEGADVVVNDLMVNPYEDRPGSWGGVTQVVNEVMAMGRKSMAITAVSLDWGPPKRASRRAFKNITDF